MVFNENGDRRKRMLCQAIIRCSRTEWLVISSFYWLSEFIKLPIQVPVSAVKRKTSINPDQCWMMNSPLYRTHGFFDHKGFFQTRPLVVSDREMLSTVWPETYSLKRTDQLASYKSYDKWNGDHPGTRPSLISINSNSFSYTSVIGYSKPVN